MGKNAQGRRPKVIMRQHNLYGMTLLRNRALFCKIEDDVFDKGWEGDLDEKYFI
jgi:hypothetical protein